MLYHYHPESGEIIEGRRLEMGETVEKGDRYAASDGKWKLPGQSVGITIQTPRVVWVRPVPMSRPQQPRLTHSVTAK